MADKLKGKKIAILAADGVEQSEYSQPLERLKAEGAEVHTVSIKDGEIKGWDKDHWGDKFKVDKKVNEVKATEYDGLVLPGGQMNPDFLRANEEAVSFVRHFHDAGKPIAAICHGPWTLIEAGVVQGKKMTSYNSIKTDLKNAGANWVDQEVVTDQGLVTSRNPGDLPAFCDKMVEEFREGRHERDATA